MGGRGARGGGGGGRGGGGEEARDFGVPLPQTAKSIGGGETGFTQRPPPPPHDGEFEGVAGEGLRGGE